jgi:hypothetical protein
MLQAETGTVSDTDTLFTSKLFLHMLIEILINSVFNPPNLNADFLLNGSILVKYDYSFMFNTTLLKNNSTDSLESNFISEETSVKLQYNISPMISLIILFRFYHLFRLVYTISFWNTVQSKQVCENINCDANLSFGLRAYLIMRPLACLFFLVCTFILFFGLSLKMCEFYNKTLTDALSDLENIGFIKIMRKFENLYNACWNILVTMSTVGYGDIYPTTYFGRGVVIFACVSGTFVMSILVVFMNNTISLDEKEQQVYKEINGDKNKLLRLQKSAIKIVRKALEYNLLRKRSSEDTHLIRFKIMYVDLRYMIKNFKEVRMLCKKSEIKIDEMLASLKYNLDTHVSPFSNMINSFNKERLMVSNNFCNFIFFFNFLIFFLIF